MGCMAMPVFPSLLLAACCLLLMVEGGGIGSGEPHHGPTSCRPRSRTAEDSTRRTYSTKNTRRPRHAAAASTYLLVDELPAVCQAMPGPAGPSHTCSCRHTHPEQAIPCRPATLISRTRSTVAVRICVPLVELQGKQTNKSERIATGPWMRGCWHQGNGADALRLALGRSSGPGERDNREKSETTR
ncbi:hypothetical protein V8C26DRAFT_77255 [Trichoderma gracile]